MLKIVLIVVFGIAIIGISNASAINYQYDKTMISALSSQNLSYSIDLTNTNGTALGTIYYEDEEIFFFDQIIKNKKYGWMIKDSSKKFIMTGTDFDKESKVTLILRNPTNVVSFKILQSDTETLIYNPNEVKNTLKSTASDDNTSQFSDQTNKILKEHQLWQNLDEKFIPTPDLDIILDVKDNPYLNGDLDLTITVKDNDGKILENASVTINMMRDDHIYSTYTDITDSEGSVYKSIFLSNPPYFPNHCDKVQVIAQYSTYTGTIEDDFLIQVADFDDWLETVDRNPINSERYLDIPNRYAQYPPIIEAFDLECNE